MPETRVGPGEKVRLGTIEGDLEVSQGARIEVDGRLVVPGTAHFEGSSSVEGSLECRSLRVEDGTVQIRGDLTVQETVRADDGGLEVTGAFRAGRVDVDKRLRIGGPAAAEEFEVGGVFEGGSTLTSPKVSVGGKLRLSGKLTGRELEAGGSVEVAEVDLETLEVGGLVRLAGGEVRRSVEVGGRFAADGPFKFGNLDVGGVVQLRGPATGGRVSVGGMMMAEKDLTFEALKIGGMGTVQGNGAGRTIEVGGKFDVRGSLKLTELLEVGGAVAIGEELTGQRLSVGGSLTARRAVLSGEAEIGGSIATQEGAKAERFRLRHRSKATGPLVGNSVEIESKGRVEDIYGGRVELGRKSVARRIFANVVRLEEGCEVEEVEYVESLDLGRNVRCRQPPRKVDHLPPFPI